MGCLGLFLCLAVVLCCFLDFAESTPAPTTAEAGASQNASLAPYDINRTITGRENVSCVPCRTWRSAFLNASVFATTTVAAGTLASMSNFEDSTAIWYLRFNLIAQSATSSGLDNSKASSTGDHTISPELAPTTGNVNTWSGVSGSLSSAASELPSSSRASGRQMEIQQQLTNAAFTYVVELLFSNDPFAAPRPDILEPRNETLLFRALFNSQLPEANPRTAVLDGYFSWQLLVHEEPGSMVLTRFNHTSLIFAVFGTTIRMWSIRARRMPGEPNGDWVVRFVAETESVYGSRILSGFTDATDGPPLFGGNMTLVPFSAGGLLMLEPNGNCVRLFMPHLNLTQSIIGVCGVTNVVLPPALQNITRNTLLGLPVGNRRWARDPVSGVGELSALAESGNHIFTFETYPQERLLLLTIVDIAMTNLSKELHDPTRLTMWSRVIQWPFLQPEQPISDERIRWITVYLDSNLVLFGADDSQNGRCAIYGIELPENDASRQLLPATGMALGDNITSLHKFHFCSHSRGALTTNGTLRVLVEVLNRTVLHSLSTVFRPDLKSFDENNQALITVPSTCFVRNDSSGRAPTPVNDNIPVGPPVTHSPGAVVTTPAGAVQSVPFVVAVCVAALFFVVIVGGFVTVFVVRRRSAKESNRLKVYSPTTEGDSTSSAGSPRPGTHDTDHPADTTEMSMSPQEASRAPLLLGGSLQTVDSIRFSNGSPLPSFRNGTLGETPPAPLGVKMTSFISGQSPHPISESPPSVEAVYAMIMDGKFRKIKLVGRGATGSVYSCLLVDGSTIALKEIALRPQEAEREIAKLQQEMSLMRQLHHPNVLQYYGALYDNTDMKLLLFTEYVQGGSLGDLVRSMDGPLADETARVYMRQVVEGLQFLHSKGVMHRDLKADNVLRSLSGAVKIADFGASRMIDLQRTTTLVASTMIGTPVFMAPEVLNGNGNLDEDPGVEAGTEFAQDSNFDDLSGRGYGRKADIWSLGILAGELVNRGRVPWPIFSNPGQAFIHISMGNLPEIPKIASPDCVEFLQSCCQQDPRKRPSAADLLNHPWLRHVTNPVSDTAEGDVRPQPGAESASFFIVTPGEADVSLSSGSPQGPSAALSEGESTSTSSEKAQLAKREGE